MKRCRCIFVPGIRAILDSFLAILAPLVSIVQDIGVGPCFDGVPGLTHSLGAPFLPNGPIPAKNPCPTLSETNQKLDPHTSLDVLIKPKRLQYSSQILSCRRHFLELSNVYSPIYTHARTHRYRYIYLLGHKLVQNCFEWIVHAMHHILFKCSHIVLLLLI